ncbi:MAG: hypothetical protein O2960_21780 [Verrucomicrobia bacterium]|nr:hypothetical protein [Verrucomicrobiota bacterium]
MQLRRRGGGIKTTSFEADRAFDPPAQVKSSIAICGVFDDDLTKFRAQRAVPHLLSELGDMLEVTFSWWRAKFLYHPRALQMASDAVAHSHVILFSCRSGHDVPLVITNWLDEALARREKGERVLVALLESGSAGSPQPSLAEACLHRIARKAKADFLFHAEPVQAGQSNSDFPIIPSRQILIGDRVPCSTTSIHPKKTL